jgi:hypothetical protein
MGPTFQSYFSLTHFTIFGLLVAVLLHVYKRTFRFSRSLEACFEMFIHLTSSTIVGLSSNSLADAA